MNAAAEGFAVDHAELDVLAGKAEELAETVRAGLRQDRFEDEKWPDTDLLRPEVIAYLRSLRSAMDRLSGGADLAAGQLRTTAESYRELDASAAYRFDRIARDE